MTEIHGSAETSGIGTNFVGDRCFLLGGRPRRVRAGRWSERLDSLPGVADAAVRLMRPEEGTRLKAFVFPDLVY
jgi:hypothetical protein